MEEIILSMRSEALTSFFKIFPLFVSDTFYITVIALGYWLAFKPRIYWQLGFLVPFSTMLNYILKNLFLCDRPDSSLHLIHIVDNSSGFPSGDVQLTAVFWGMLMYNYRSNLFHALASAVILGVMASRVYLGVHTVAQVFGGLFFGIITVWFMTSSIARKMFSLWENGSTSTYWLICFITASVCFITSQTTMPLIIALSGVLLGYGLSLSFAKNYMDQPKRQLKFIIAGCGLGSLFLVNRLMPKVHYTSATWVDLIFLVKYCIIGLVIFTIIPLAIKKRETFALD